MSKPLYQNHLYQLALPAPYDSEDIAQSRNDVASVHGLAVGGRVKTHAPTIRAVRAVLDARSRFNTGVAIGMSGDTVVVERMASDGSIEVATYAPETGQFRAGIFTDPNSAITHYSLKKASTRGVGAGKKSKDGTALLIAIVANEMQTNRNAELMDEIKMFDSLDAADEESAEAISKCCAVISDNIYRRVISADTLNENIAIKVEIPASLNVPPITAQKLRLGAYSPDKVIMGEFTILQKGAPGKNAKVVINVEDLPGKYAFNERSFAPLEQALIPSIPAWYVVPEEVVKLCSHAKATSSSNVPMRNFMLRGPAGVGKTEGARAMAAAMNLPYVSLTCSANSEIFDLLGQILPDVEGIDGASGMVNLPPPILHCPELPNLQDIQMDPGTAYEKLTGVYDEDVTEDTVYMKLLEVIGQQAYEKASAAKEDVDNQTGQRFRYVDTPLVQAMKYGYLLEVQEPSVIANPGVLVGLNSLLDGCKQITLPTGETVHRHPDTVVVVTTNYDYAGCRDVNQSVISRMNLVFDIDEPTEDDMVARVKSITGCADEDDLFLMVSVVKDIQLRCHETSITDGSCGMRELVSWAQSYMITNNMLESAKYTILSSVSADPVDRADILNTCILPKIA